MRTLFFFIFGAMSAFSQPFTFGLKAGVPLTDLVETVQGPRTGFIPTPKRYIAGATAELRLPFGLGFEVDALYRRLNYQSGSSFADVITNNRTTGNAWEFPLLGKYRLPTKIIRPYVDAGVAFDTISGLKQTVTRTVSNLTNTTTTSNPNELRRNYSVGFVVGGGIDVHALFLHISPEIRYTRWGARQIDDFNGALHSNQNQAEFLLGITF